jgi:hypothetical protein
MSEEINKYKDRMEGKFTPGDSTPDYIDESGKPWMAKKDENPEELKLRAKGQVIESKTPPETEEDDDN